MSVREKALCARALEAVLDRGSDADLKEITDQMTDGELANLSAALDRLYPFIVGARAARMYDKRKTGGKRGINGEGPQI